MRPWKIVLTVAIISVGLGLFSSYYMYSQKVVSCQLCGISINPTFEARLHLKDGTVKRYCCVNDALHAYRELMERVEWVSVTEQETGEKLNATDVIFVENDIMTCAPCGTKLHIFEAETHGGLFYEHRVNKYMKKFGGKIVDNPFLAIKRGLE
jgi:hypothetical protein